jgi:hypothetical protein
MAFWHIASYSLIGVVSQHPVVMEAVHTSETFAYFNGTTWCYNPVRCNFHFWLDSDGPVTYGLHGCVSDLWYGHWDFCLCCDVHNGSGVHTFSCLMSTGVSSSTSTSCVSIERTIFSWIPHAPKKRPKSRVHGLFALKHRLHCWLSQYDNLCTVLAYPSEASKLQ